MVKATFSLDRKTIAEIRRAAARLGKSQSHVVSEAVAEYAARSNRLTEHERLYLLGILAKVSRAKPKPRRGKGTTSARPARRRTAGG